MPVTTTVYHYVVTDSFSFCHEENCWIFPFHSQGPQKEYKEYSSSCAVCSLVHSLVLATSTIICQLFELRLPAILNHLFIFLYLVWLLARQDPKLLYDTITFHRAVLLGQRTGDICIYSSALISSRPLSFYWYKEDLWWRQKILAEYYTEWLFQSS